MIQDRSRPFEMELEYIANSTSKARKITMHDSPRSSPIAMKQVRFSESSTLIITQPKSSTEKQASWYTKKDFSQFRSDARACVKSLSETRSHEVIEHIAYSVVSGTPLSSCPVLENERICGIEHLVSHDVLKVLVQRRKMAVARVLDEQDVQCSMGIKDSNRIAHVSMANSAFTKEWRRRIACLQQL
jgi:hypothetical protein